MDEIAQKYLDCKTKKDYLDFIIYLHKVIRDKGEWDIIKEGWEEKLDITQFCNKLINLSHISLENLARKE